MKIYLWFNIISCWFVLNACSQTAVGFVGRWEYIGTGNEIIECPDIIEFQPNGKYIILNDCYGLDPKNPIVETGRWSIEKGNIIRLKRRRFTTNYSPYNFNDPLDITVLDLKNNQLILKVINNQREVYKRLK